MQHGGIYTLLLCVLNLSVSGPLVGETLCPSIQQVCEEGYSTHGYSIKDPKDSGKLCPRLP